jgi:hypothetical protein
MKNPMKLLPLIPLLAQVVFLHAGENGHAQAHITDRGNQIERVCGVPDSKGPPGVISTSGLFSDEQLQIIKRGLVTCRASIDDSAPGFQILTDSDFAKVNGADGTWTWKEGVLHCSGEPLGVLRTSKPYRNFEFVVEWMHENPAGNSGIFVWTTPESIEKLTTAGKPGLPQGIEVQILDHEFAGQTAAAGKSTDWFTTHGDVFAVGVKMKPFPPLSPNGSRSFPRKKLTKGHGNWNHYYIRAINGEVRLWVNGEEVSGGNECDPAAGYLCLESEGSPIQFRNFRIRELP